jgi:hypothetical protein
MDDIEDLPDLVLYFVAFQKDKLLDGLAHQEPCVA